MAHQLSPYLNKGVLESSMCDPGMHKVWMCFCIYARLLLNAQCMGKSHKTVLLMFLAKLMQQSQTLGDMQYGSRWTVLESSYKAVWLCGYEPRASACGGAK